MFPTGQAPLPMLLPQGQNAAPQAHRSTGSGGTTGMGTGPCLQNPAVMETSPPLHHGNTTQITTHDVPSPRSHLSERARCWSLY